MKREQLELRLTHSADGRFGALVKAMDQDYVQQYGDLARNDRTYNTLEDLEQVCLLVQGKQAVACGAFQRLDETTAQLKRVYVRPEFRRRGYAGQLIEVLELQALFSGYTRMALETGRDRAQALRLSARLGYRETAAWGPFAGDGACLCMAKELS